MSTAISACLIVRNESQLLAGCLESIRNLCREIIVVDTGSTDDTCEIARRAGARVFHHRWDDDYARARNASLSHARGEWILVIDGDETIAARDLPEIRCLVTRARGAGYRLLVRNYTRDFNVTWNWHPNDGSYPKEEQRSRCPGWTRTWALRLFRNAENVGYASAGKRSAHVSLERSLRAAGSIENCGTVAIHHFERIKRGGARFIQRKQQLRLLAELGRANDEHDADAFVNAAKTLFSQKRDDEATRLLVRAITRYPRYRDAHHLQGLIDLASGRLPDARERFRTAVEVEPGSADSWALLGVVCIEGGWTAEAASALERALSLQPSHLVARNSLGVLCEDLGRASEARRHYRAALRLHPGFTPARKNLARLMKLQSAANGRRKGGPPPR